MLILDEHVKKFISLGPGGYLTEEEIRWVFDDL